MSYILKYAGTITESQISDLQSYLTAVVAANVNAEASTDGWVLTSDGAGNAAWEAVPAGGGGLVATDSPEITGDWQFNPNGTGALTAYDVSIGDTDGTPTYGIARLGNSIIGRTSHNAAGLDLDGSFLIRNVGAPATSNIEFAFAESSNSVRFAIPKSGVGNATYNPRSMLIAGPAPSDDAMVTVGYWQGVGLFDNLACDTGTDGADLGVQNDLEVEGDIFTDSILESTSAAGVTVETVLIKDGLVDGLDVGLLDTDLQTFALPASTTISAFGATVVDDADAATARATLGVDVAGTDNSTDVTLAGQDYLTLSSQQITANKLNIDDLADGTDGELITWSATGVAATVAVGTATHVLTSNGVGAAPTFQAAGGGSGVTASPGAFELSGSHNITTTESTIPFDTEVFDPDTNYSNASGVITCTASGYYHVDVNVPVNDDGTGGATRGAVFGFLQKDASTSTWTTVNHIRGQVYEREASGGTGFHAAGIVSLVAGEAIRFRVDVTSSVDVSTESGQASLNIHKIRDA